MKIISKIFIFWGQDIGKNTDKLFLQLQKDGYLFLPIDTAAIAYAHKLSLPFTFIDCLLDNSKILKARKTAEACERNWFFPARDDFYADNICWPKFDRHAMHWFWIDVLLALTFTESVKNSNIKKLGFIENNTCKPAIFYSLSDVVKALLKNDLDIISPKNGNDTNIKQSSQNLPIIKNFVNCKKSTAKRIINKTNILINNFKYNFVKTSERIIDRKIVLAFNHGEFYRFSPMIEHLSEAYPNEIAGVILSTNQKLANEIEKKWSIPVVCCPTPPQLDPELQKKFLNGYKKVLENCSIEYIKKSLKYLPFHFKFYCQERWPTLTSKLRAWEELWTKTNPKAVIVSSLQDSESQLPAEAAKRYNIPTFSVPHGVGIVRSWEIISSDYVCYSMYTHKKIYERSGIVPERLIPCRGITPENEYQTRSKPSFGENEMWKILALTDPVILPGILSNMISTSAQIEALKVLDNPPLDIARKVSVKIKVHPHWSDLELYKTVSKKLERSVLPVDSDLKKVLESTDLVVAVNYFGGALVHILRENKPVIFLLTDKNIGKVDPLKHADVYLSGGTCVNNGEQFWRQVKLFFYDAESAKKMRSKAKKYYSKYLDDQNYPQIGDMIKQKLQNRYLR